MVALRRFGFALFVLLSIGVAGYGVFVLTDAEHTPLVMEKLKNVDFQTTPWIYMLYLHVASSLFCLLVGPFQFLPQVIKRVRLHRTLGMTYVLSILFGGLSGFWLALYASGGWVAKSGFALLAVLWLYTTFVAMKKIRKRQIQEHKQWMYRSYALSLGAISLRIWLTPLIILFGDFETAYKIVAWLAWVPNLLLVEVWLRRQSKTSSRPHVTSSVR